MSSLSSLSGIACWYWALALAISAYQAYRGFRFQWFFGLDSRRCIAAEAAQAAAVAHEHEQLLWIVYLPLNRGQQLAQSCRPNGQVFFKEHMLRSIA